MASLDKIRARCELATWEDSDDTPISFVGTLGTLRKLLAVAEAARDLAEEARPHTDFQRLWGARDKVKKALAALEAE